MKAPKSDVCISRANFTVRESRPNYEKEEKGWLCCSRTAGPPPSFLCPHCLRHSTARAGDGTGSQTASAPRASGSNSVSRELQVQNWCRTGRHRARPAVTSPPSFLRRPGPSLVRRPRAAGADHILHGPGERAPACARPASWRRRGGLRGGPGRERQAGGGAPPFPTRRAHSSASLFAVLPRIGLSGLVWGCHFPGRHAHWTLV